MEVHDFIPDALRSPIGHLATLIKCKERPVGDVASSLRYVENYKDRDAEQLLLQGGDAVLEFLSSHKIGKAICERAAEAVDSRQAEACADEQIADIDAQNDRILSLSDREALVGAFCDPLVALTSAIIELLPRKGSQTRITQSQTRRVYEILDTAWSHVIGAIPNLQALSFCGAVDLIAGEAVEGLRQVS